MKSPSSFSSSSALVTFVKTIITVIYELTLEKSGVSGDLRFSGGGKSYFGRGDKKVLSLYGEVFMRRKNEEEEKKAYR